MDDRRFLMVRTRAWMAGLWGDKLPRSEIRTPAELRTINEIYEHAREKRASCRLSVLDAMRLAQYRIDRGRDDN